MFGMTLSFATAGIGQVYLERILGVGFLETQLKIQVHFLMLIGTGFIFTIGAALYIYDFFRTRPHFTLVEDDALPAGEGRVRGPAAA
jgi:nitric oxide reductase subunit B